MADFGTFEAVPTASLPKGVRVFKHRWVDTSEKSRLTMMDLKVFGTSSVVGKNCPTPSALSKGLFDWFTARFGCTVITYDVVAAFPHE